MSAATLNRKEHDVPTKSKTKPKRSSNGVRAGTRSVKISDRAYRAFERIAKNEQRTIVAVIDRAAAHYDTATNGGKLS